MTGTVGVEFHRRAPEQEVMHLNDLCRQTEAPDLNCHTNRQLIKVRPSLGLIPCRERRRQPRCSFNLMVLTGIIPGQALGADLAELSINKVLTLTWDGGN